MALHDSSWARALASLGGVALVSFVVVACNALVLDLLVDWRRARRAGGDAAPRSGSSSWCSSSASRRSRGTSRQSTGRIRFALLQGNDQNRTLTPEEISSDYLFRRHLALADRLEGKYDLIVFPESSLERDPTTNPDVRDALVQDRARITTRSSSRTPASRRKDGGLYNANVAYGPDGELQGVYAKQHLVPFGEYVPLRDQLVVHRRARADPVRLRGG